MKKIAIIQARMNSSRLPDKVLKNLGGKPILAWVADSAQKIPAIDKVVIATSSEASDDPIEKWCVQNDVECFRGSLDDVLDRFASAAKKYNADIVMRLTADCPLLDPKICGEVLQLLIRTNADYASNCTTPSWPDGLDCEAFTNKALQEAAKNAKSKAHREHVTGYIHQNRYVYNVKTHICPLPDLHKERWTVDNAEDFELVSKIVENGEISSYLDVLDILDKNPKFREINRNIKRNEGLQKTIAQDTKPQITNFKNSEKLIVEAEKYIPLGSQTFSKSRVQYPVGNAPLFISHGNGSHVWDVDGNEYIDLVSALLPVVLGYNDPDIDYAIRQQLSNGITFSLPSVLETKLAKKLVEIIPCAEKVRFAKNGTDCTSAAIRLARAYTGREKIMVCGYHGWQDWYIGSTTRDKGVPKAVRELTYKVPFNNLEAVEKLLKESPEGFAAMILEPMNVENPKDGYLQDLKDLLHKYGALLVFDETITGFRYSLGGAQELFGITPDLATFGKAMGNGMPISAIVGKAPIMDEMEEIFFSGTFGGETLSIAAAIALIDKMQREPVIETLWKTGNTLRNEVQKSINKYGLNDVIALNGKDPWVLVGFSSKNNVRVEAIKTLWQKEMIASGVLTIGAHNICYSHSESDVAAIVNAYNNVLPKILSGINSGNLERDLDCKVLEPVFKVR